MSAFRISASLAGTAAALAAMAETARKGQDHETLLKAAAESAKHQAGLVSSTRV